MSGGEEVEEDEGTEEEDEGEEESEGTQGEDKDEEEVAARVRRDMGTDDADEAESEQEAGESDEEVEAGGSEEEGEEAGEKDEEGEDVTAESDEDEREEDDDDAESEADEVADEGKVHVESVEEDHAEESEEEENAEKSEGEDEEDVEGEESEGEEDTGKEEAGTGEESEDEQPDDEEESQEKTEKRKSVVEVEGVHESTDAEISKESEVDDEDIYTAPEESEAREEEDEGQEEEQEEAEILPSGQRSRKHISTILGYKDIGTEVDKEEERLIQEILKELKKLSINAIQPMENLYKFKDISTRVLGDAEIFNKPLVLFLGPWSSGKSSIINYLLGTEHTKAGLKTGPQPTDVDFTIIHHTEKLQRISGTEMAAHWAFSGVQKFGQRFLDHFKGIGLPHPLLQKVTIVDTPGILEKRRVGYPLNDVFQWFIDRADAIYFVFDPSKLEIGEETTALIDQIKGRESQTRFLLNKADFVQPHDIMRVTGQLLWNVSPLLGSSEAPIIYTVSLTSRPFHKGTPAKFFLEQERAFLEHLREIMDERVENTISFTRRHAVRVRNHAKLVDCYLSTFYKQKGIFGSKRKVAEQITKEPQKFHIYEGLSKLTNVSRYDLPDPQLYYKFFKLNPLYEFKQLSETCSYFKGCPLDKLDIAIAYDLPQLLGKYNEKTKIKRDQDSTPSDESPVPMSDEEKRKR